MNNKKTIIITGGNAGIGKAIAISLAKMNHHVVVISRDPEKGKTALSNIINESGNNTTELVVGNLDTIRHTKDLAADLKVRFPDISVLINNAGVWNTNLKINEDGLEDTFMVNHIAPFILSNLLLNTLKMNVPARIINVNAKLYVYGKFNIEKTPFGMDFGKFKTYMNSKLCNVLFTRRFSELIKGTGVTINAVHPGVIRTNLGLSSGMLDTIIRVMKIGFGSPSAGAVAPVWMASAPEMEGIDGKFFMLKKETEYTQNALDNDLMNQLWEYTSKLTGITFPI